MPDLTTTAPRLTRRGALHTLGTAALLGTGLAAGSAALSAPASASGRVETASKHLYQPNSYYCGPTSVWMVLSAKMATPPSLATIAAHLETEEYGATPFWTIDDYLSATMPGATYSFQKVPTKPATSYSANLLWERVTENVRNGYPSIAYWQASAGSYPLWHGNTSRIGHYVVIDGYDPDTRELLIADPAGSALGGFTAPAYYWLPLWQVANLCGVYDGWDAGYFW